jgi:hypothetical protein
MRMSNSSISEGSITEVKLKNGILACRRILSKTLLIAVGVMCAAVVAVLLMTKALAAPGDLDLSLVSSGKVATDISGLDEVGTSISVRSDGKPVVATTTNLSSAMNRPTQSKDRRASARARHKRRRIPTPYERWRDFL